jgi:hypothetical protein
MTCLKRTRARRTLIQQPAAAAVPLQQQQQQQQLLLLLLLRGLLPPPLPRQLQMRRLRGQPPQQFGLHARPQAAWRRGCL